MAYQIKRLLTTVCLFYAFRNIDASKTKQNHHHDSPKTWHNFPTFEGDIVPEYRQVLESYGIVTTAELVVMGVLSARTDTNCTEPQTVSLGRKYYHLWPTRIQDVTLIPYEFATGAFGATKQSIIEQAMQDLADLIGVVRFVTRRIVSHHLPYLLFRSDKVHQDNPYLAQYPACWTHVGWQGTSHNIINLEGGCISPGFVKHELLHTLGMWHLTSRWDRDDFVTVLWENVFPGFEYCFRKRTLDDTLGFPYYDYDSIMNNANTDFAQYGTEAWLSPVPIGQLDHVSVGPAPARTASMWPAPAR